MSVTEATLGLMSTMSEEELLEMYHQARRIIDQRKCHGDGLREKNKK